jgi:hypothetical protein
VKCKEERIVINLGEVIDAAEPQDRTGWLMERISGAVEGERNNTLFWVACAMFRLVANGELDRAKAVQMLRDASTRNGFIGDDGVAQFERTVASAERSVKQRGAA